MKGPSVDFIDCGNYNISLKASPVRRQNLLDSWPPELRDTLAHLSV